VIGIIPGVENMPLQIRRGTDAERLAMTQPLAQGELLYVTNDQRLYIGNGSTLGGIQITGYNNEDAQDAAALLFSNGTHTGITFTYNDASASLSAALDLSNFSGTIRADAFKGSVFADDGSTIGGTLLVDAVDGKINLDGTVKGNIIPNANEAYDLGSNAYRFKDLYLKGTSLYLGNAVLTNPSSTIINLPAGSTIGGTAIGTLANQVGDFVFTTNTIDIGSSTARLNSTNVLALSVSALTTGTSGGIPAIELRSSKGTIASPTTTAAGDQLSTFSFSGYANGDYQAAATMLSAWESSATLTDAAPASKLTIVVGAGGSSLSSFIFSGKGLSAPTVTVGSYATGSLPSGATAGTIAYDSTTNQFKGWNGGSWAVLG
jgi:hypothetical protein